MTNNDQGSVIVTVMVYILIMIIISTAVLGVAISEYSMETAHRDVVKAYYVAEAGAEKAIFSITEMKTIEPRLLKNKEWVMETKDYDLVETGIKADFTVTVLSVDVFDEIFIGEDEDIKLYKTIYEVSLKSVAVYKEAPAALRADILIENYAEAAEGVNRVEVRRWRQIRGEEDAD